MSNLIFHTGQSVKLDFSLLVNEFSSLTSSFDYWVMQHWQGLPKPKKGNQDIRKFGYLCKEKDNYVYHTVSYDNFFVDSPIIFHTLQSALPFTGKLPTAVNFFPDTLLVISDKAFHLRCCNG